MSNGQNTRKEFYDFLASSNIKMPDYETYDKALDDPAMRREFYGFLTSHQVKMPEYEVFDFSLAPQGRSAPATPQPPVVPDLEQRRSILPENLRESLAQFDTGDRQQQLEREYVQAGTTEQPGLEMTTPADAAKAGASAIVKPVEFALERVEDVVTPILASLGKMAEGAPNVISGLAKIKPRGIKNTDAAAQTLRGFGQLGLGALHTVINSIPAMMVVNATTGAIGEPMQDTLAKTVAGYAEAIRKNFTPEMDEKILRHVAQQYGAKAADHIINVSVGAYFGLPVLAGMIVSEGVGSTVDNIIKDKDLKQEDKDLMVGWAQDLSFLLVAGGIQVGKKKLGEVGKYEAEAGVEGFTDVMREMSQQPTREIKGGPGRRVGPFGFERPAEPVAPAPVVPPTTVPSSPRGQFVLNQLEKSIDAAIQKGERFPVGQLLSKEVADLVEPSPSLKARFEGLAAKVEEHNKALPEGRKIPEVPGQTVTPLDKPIPAIEEGKPTAIPEFKSSNEAIEFGRANAERAKEIEPELVKRRKEAEAEFRQLVDAKQNQEAMRAAIRGQFASEALEFLKNPKLETPIEKFERQRAEETKSPTETPKPPVETEKPAARQIREEPLENIDVDTQRFQPRVEGLDTALQEERMKVYDRTKIEENPIIVWRDPKDSRFKVLAGDHRRDLLQRAGEKTAPVIEFIGTEKEAIKRAATENAERAAESILDRANYYHTKIQEGVDLKTLVEEAKGRGEKHTTILAIAHLNPKGKAIEAVKSLQKGDLQSSNRVVEMAEWVGEARRRYPELTDLHEGEMFDFVKSRYGMAGARNKTEFLSRIEGTVQKLGEFDKTKPLNLERHASKTATEQEYENRIVDAKKSFDEARRRRLEKQEEFVARGASKERLDELMKPYEYAETIAEREYRGLLEKKADALREIRQGETDLFAQLEDLTNAELRNAERAGERRTAKEIEDADAVVKTLESEVKAAEDIADAAKQRERAERAKDVVDEEIGKLTKPPEETKAEVPPVQPKEGVTLANLEQGLKPEAKKVVDDAVKGLDDLFQEGVKNKFGNQSELFSIAGIAAYGSVDALPIDDDLKKILKSVLGVATIAGIAIALSGRGMGVLKEIESSAKRERTTVSKAINKFLKSEEAKNLPESDRTILQKLAESPKINVVATEIAKLDEITYQKTKYYFDQAHDALRNTGKTLNDLAAIMVERYGEKIRPYVERYVDEVKAEGTVEITSDKAANLSLRRFEEPAREGISNLTSAQESSTIEAQRRGVRPHEVTEQAARAQGEIVRKARKGEIEPGTALNAEQIEALDSEVNRVGKLSPKEILENENPQEVANLLRTTYGVHAEAGRALNILGKNIDPSVAQNFLKIAEQTKDPVLKNAVEKAIDFLEKGEKIPPGFWDKVAEWGRNIKLASMSGLIRSLVGNSVMQVFRYPEAFGSALANKVLATITGKRKDRFMQEIVADIIGTKTGIKDGLRRAAALLKEEPTALSDNLFLEMEIPDSRGAIKGTLGKVIRTPQRAQGAMDLIFRVPAYKGAIGKLAVRKAFQEGLKDEAWARRVDELIQKPTADMVLQANLDSRYLTFQSPLGPIAAGVNYLRSAHPVMQLPVPFFSTAANLFKAIVERTPFAPLTPSFQQALFEALGKPGKQKGSLEYGFERATGKKFEPQIGNLSDRVSRMVAGTTFMVLTGVVLNKVLDGEITGRGPRSATERDALFRTGWMPYSIRLGGRYISYRGFEPLTGWLSMLADYNQGYKEDGIEEAFIRSSVNLIKNFAENPFLVGVKDIMDGLTDVEGKRAEKAIAGFIVGMTVPTIVKQTRNVIDPTVRKSGGVAESIQSQLPLASEELLPKRNVFGEPIQIESPGTRLLGFSTSARKTSQLETELERLKLNLSWPSDMYGEVKLTPEQYDKLLVVAGTGLKITLEGLVQSPSWGQMTDGNKIDAIRHVQDKIRDIVRIGLFPDVKMESELRKMERDFIGGELSDDERKRMQESFRRNLETVKP